MLEKIADDENKLSAQLRSRLTYAKFKVQHGFAARFTNIHVRYDCWSIFEHLHVTQG